MIGKLRLVPSFAILLLGLRVSLADRVQPFNHDPTGYQKGFMSLTAGALEEAEAAFQETLARDPKQVAGLIGLAEVALRRNKAQVAAGHLQEALKLAPTNAAVQTVWGRYLSLQGLAECPEPARGDQPGSQRRLSAYRLGPHLS